MKKKKSTASEPLCGNACHRLCAGNHGLPDFH